MINNEALIISLHVLNLFLYNLVFNVDVFEIVFKIMKLLKFKKVVIIVVKKLEGSM